MTEKADALSPDALSPDALSPDAISPEPPHHTESPLEAETRHAAHQVLSVATAMRNRKRLWPPIPFSPGEAQAMSDLLLTVETLMVVAGLAPEDGGGA